MADEEPSPLERMLAVADSGNGASWELDINRWYFINPELTVHLHPHREAAGEWICLDAQTTISTACRQIACAFTPRSSLAAFCRPRDP